MDVISAIASPIIGLFNIVAKPVGQYFTEGQKIKAATSERKDELTKLKLEATLQSIAKSENLNLELDSKNGADPIPWANDVSFVLFLAPAVLAFYPPALPHIMAGFTAIGNMPLFWQYSLGMMLVSVWGYRNLVEPIVKSLAKVWLGRKGL